MQQLDPGVLPLWAVAMHVTSTFITSGYIRNAAFRRKVLEFDSFELLGMCIRQRSHGRLEYHRQQWGTRWLIPGW